MARYQRECFQQVALISDAFIIDAKATRVTARGVGVGGMRRTLAWIDGANSAIMVKLVLVSNPTIISVQVDLGTSVDDGGHRFVNNLQAWIDKPTAHLRRADKPPFEPTAANALSSASHPRLKRPTIARTHRTYESSHSVRGSGAWRDAGSHRAGRHRYGARDWRPMSCAG